MTCAVMRPRECLVWLRACWREHLAHWLWVVGGRRPPPPPATKARVLRGLARRFGLRIFVETGTYCGDMVATLRREFDLVYTIELSDELFARACTRFAGDAGVHVLHGDSGDLLPQVLSGIEQPALFWLDGHYSGGITAKGSRETPILAELSALAAQAQCAHVIVIDDASCHGILPDYPTLPELRVRLREIWPHAEIVEEANMVQVLPRAPR